MAFLPTGCYKVPPVKLACNASAPSIYPGEAETVTATPSDVTTRKHWDTIYNWSGQGVTGNEAAATVDTTSLTPGDYTVKGEIKEGKKGEEGATGRKKNDANEVAACEAPFTVKPFEPPTVSCSANPSTVTPGESSTITTTASSPQNLPLTYSYSASAGSISGTSDTATLSTTGAPSGTITVTCNAADNHGHTVSATTTVDVQAPPPPPAPKTQTLCTAEFSRDKYRPTRVDNEAKACLDDVALNAQQKPDATIVLVGNSAPTRTPRTRWEKRHWKTAEELAAQRAVNVKAYLVTEKGIDPSRIQVRTDSTGMNEVQDYLVPAGANFNNDVPGTAAVDESQYTAQPRNPVHHHHHHHKKAAAAAATGTK
jgi:outer membrane protein OmpA-like peptidoglycan-associated protein